MSVAFVFMLKVCSQSVYIIEPNLIHHRVQTDDENQLH